MTPDEAKQAVEAALEQAEAAKRALLDGIKAVWPERIDALVTKAVTGQPSVTKGIPVEELAVLKANLAMAVTSAVGSVDSTFDSATNIQRLARGARQNVTGNIRVSLGDGITRLAQPVHGFLEKAGYNMQLLKSGHGSYSSSEFMPNDIALNLYGPEHAFNEAVEAYGKALLHLAAVQHEVDAEEAKSLWDGV